MLGDSSMDTVDHRLGLARQMCDAKRSLPAFDTRPRGIDDITHGLLLSELHNRISCKVEKLFMLNSLRRSFEVKGQNLQLPFYRHGRGRIANRLVAGLILQIAGNGNSPLLRKDRTESICSARRRYREILGNAKLSLEDRYMFLDGFQVQYFRARVNDRLQFDSWKLLQGELNRFITLHSRRIDMYTRGKFDFGNQTDPATWYDAAIGLCKGKLEMGRFDVLSHFRAQLREEFRNDIICRESVRVLRCEILFANNPA